MEFEKKNNHAEYMDPEAQIFVTPNFQSFIKPKTYQNKNKKLRKINVEYLTENFEPEDVDNDKIYAENEFYYLSENNPAVNDELKEIKQYSRHSRLMTKVGVVTNEARLKGKLLDRLEKSSKNADQNAEEFRKKFEMVLKKDNSKFIQSCFDKMKNIEYSIGLEFAGSLLEMVQASDDVMVDTLEKCELGPELEVSETYERAHILSDSLFMFAQDNRDNEDYGVSVLHFYRGVLSEDKKKFDFKRLELEPKYESRNYIYKTKFFEQANLLVFLSRPGVDENTIITIYEVFITETKVRMEARHKIMTEAEHVEFVRSNGVDYIAYTTDNYEKKTDLKLSLANLSDTLETPTMKPRVMEIPMETLFYRPFHLNNNLMLIEGDKDELALFDVTTKEFIAFYKNHDKKDYYNFFQACYAKSKNLIFVLHNNQNGAIITSFTIDTSSRKLIYRENFNLYETLKASKLNPYINQYFIMQFNPSTNRLNLTDDDFQVLFTLKINQHSKLEKDKEPNKLEKFEVRDSSCWGHFVRLEGEAFFMHYFPYESILRMYTLKED